MINSIRREKIQMTAKEIIPIAVAFVEAAAKNKSVGKFVCGEYTDGSVRSMVDAIRGEVTSPSDVKKKKKKHKKHKKNKKKKKSTNYYDGRFQL